jgi:hypothetical protein
MWIKEEILSPFPEVAVGYNEEDAARSTLLPRRHYP